MPSGPKNTRDGKTLCFGKSTAQIWHRRKNRRVSVDAKEFSVMARDGIEPPTPAFSGLLTDNAKRFGINASSWSTKAYSGGHLGLIGMIWAVFSSSMFPYCSLDSCWVCTGPWVALK